MFRNLHIVRTGVAIALLAQLGLPAHAAAKVTLRKAQASVEASTSGAKESAALVPNLIVKYKDTSTAGTQERAAIARIGLQRAGKLASIASRHGVTVNYTRRLATGGDLFKLSRPMSTLEAFRMAAEIKRENPEVQYAEPDLILHAMATSTTYTPNDPLFPKQWDMFEPAGSVNAQNAWSTTLGQGATVAVLDTGVTLHPDLVPNLLQGYNFVSDTTPGNGGGRGPGAIDPGDACPSAGSNSSWHGTHVTGTIAAVGNNGIGVTGVAPQAKVLPVRVLGQCGGQTSDIVDGMVWAAGGAVNGVPTNTTPVKAMNMSLGSENPCLNTFHDAVIQVNQLGAAVIVAAGNASHNVRDAEPASCPGVIAVGANNRAGGRAYYSNYGAMVAVSAPGGELFLDSPPDNGIISTLNDGATTLGNYIYAYDQGTSMATPHVTGTVALMLSVNPNLTPAQIRQILISTARPFGAYCAACGAGIVDAAAAVQAAATAK
jgi:serine protease